MSELALNNMDEIEAQKLELYKSIAEWPDNAQYTLEERLEVAAQYSLTGSLRETSKRTGVPETTICYWKKNAPWWDDHLAMLRSENAALFDSKAQQIIAEGQDEILDRVRNGDPHVLRDGTVIRKPVDSKSLATVVGIMFDKQRIVNMLPTSISSNANDALAKVLGQLAEVGQNMQKPAINAERVDKPELDDK